MPNSESFIPVIVKKGDTLFRLFGMDWDKIYSADANSRFRQDNPDPNKIKTGSIILVPRYEEVMFLVVVPGLTVDTPNVSSFTSVDDILYQTDKNPFKAYVVITSEQFNRRDCNRLVKPNIMLFGGREVPDIIKKRSGQGICLFGQCLTSDDSPLKEWSLDLSLKHYISFVQEDCLNFLKSGDAQLISKDSLVAACNTIRKYFVVSHESYNLT